MYGSIKNGRQIICACMCLRYLTCHMTGVMHTIANGVDAISNGAWGYWYGHQCQSSMAIINESGAFVHFLLPSLRIGHTT